MRARRAPGVVVWFTEGVATHIKRLAHPRPNRARPGHARPAVLVCHGGELLGRGATGDKAGRALRHLPEDLAELGGLVAEEAPDAPGGAPDGDEPPAAGATAPPTDQLIGQSVFDLGGPSAGQSVAALVVA